MIFDRLVRLILPRQDQFFVLLEEIAGKMTAAAAVFGELSTATGHNLLATISGRLKPIETEADHVCHRFFEELDRTFVTPIDREDLAALTKALDDVIDAMEHAAAFAALYRFEALTDPMRQLVSITVKAVAELTRAVGNLRKFNDPESIRGPTVAVHTLENEADIVYRKAVEKLFLDGMESRELVRQKDMLFSLEAGVDECEDAMDVIRSVMVKNGYAAVLLVLVIILALAFDYINGFHDTANAVATVVSTNVLPGRTAVLMAAAFNFIGAFAGTGVAHTIGGDIADPATITQTVVVAALLGAIAWNLLTWYYGIPSSSSHALIGGIVGAVWCHKVLESDPAGSALGELLTSRGVTLAVKALIISPLMGFLGGFALMVLLLWAVKPLRPAVVNRGFRVLQLVSACFMALAHGSNDAQKSMGIIAMAIAAYRATHSEPGAPPPALEVPIWAIIGCATAMALGTASGGWRIMKTMGHKIIRLRPINGFAAESAAAAVILTASALHAPVSTTHVISASIMGVGASKRVSAVRWGVARNILMAWVLTIPISAIVSAAVYWLLFHLIGP